MLNLKNKLLKNAFITTFILFIIFLLFSFTFKIQCFDKANIIYFQNTQILKVKKSNKIYYKSQTIDLIISGNSIKTKVIDVHSDNSYYFINVSSIINEQFINSMVYIPTDKILLIHYVIKDIFLNVE